MFEKAREIKRRHLTGGEGGFTLIELLIVIVVLGILAAIVVFALGGVTGQSAIAACTSDAKTVSIAVSAFEAQNPNTTPTGGNQGNLVQGINGTTYLKSWPSNPTYYQISLGGTNSDSVMVALAPNTPGADLDGSPTSTTFGTPEAYDGPSAFTFPTNSTITGETIAGDGICSGA